MLGPIVEQAKHAVADARPDTEDALELVGACLVDGEKAEVEVGHLHESVRSFHDVGQDLLVGERFGDALLKHFVELLQPGFRGLAFSDVDCRADHPDAFASFVEDAAALCSHPPNTPVFLADGSVLDVIEGAPRRIHRRLKCGSRSLQVGWMQCRL